MSSSSLLLFGSISIISGENWISSKSSPNTSWSVGGTGISSVSGRGGGGGISSDSGRGGGCLQPGSYIGYFETIGVKPLSRYGAWANLTISVLLSFA